MKGNAVRRLQFLGQSVWISALGRNIIADGTLRRLIADDGVSGIILAVAPEKDGEHASRYGETLRLTLTEAIEAADLLAPVYRISGGSNGFACIEVRAQSTEGIVAEAHALRLAVCRPNVLIKVPTTPAGLRAISCLIADGIGVNAGTICSIDRYMDALDAYLAGLEARQLAKQPIGHVISVASFALASIDALADQWLTHLAQDAGPVQEKTAQLRGKSAVACAKMAYRDFRFTLQRRRFQALAQNNAQPQRLLWDSTGAQGPEAGFSYIEPLIGPDTICAMSPEMLDAYRQRGCPASTLSKGFAEADNVISDLHELGFDVDCLDIALSGGMDPASFIPAINGKNAMSAAMP